MGQPLDRPGVRILWARYSVLLALAGDGQRQLFSFVKPRISSRPLLGNKKIILHLPDSCVHSLGRPFLGAYSNPMSSSIAFR